MRQKGHQIQCAGSAAPVVDGRMTLCLGLFVVGSSKVGLATGTLFALQFINATARNHDRNIVKEGYIYQIHIPLVRTRLHPVVVGDLLGPKIFHPLRAPPNGSGSKYCPNRNNAIFHERDE